VEINSQILNISARARSTSAPFFFLIDSCFLCV